MTYQQLETWAAPRGASSWRGRRRRRHTRCTLRAPAAAGVGGARPPPAPAWRRLAGTLGINDSDTASPGPRSPPPQPPPSLHDFFFFGESPYEHLRRTREREYSNWRSVYFYVYLQIFICLIWKLTNPNNNSVDGAPISGIVHRICSSMAPQTAGVECANNVLRRANSVADCFCSLLFHDGRKLPKYRHPLRPHFMVRYLTVFCNLSTA